MSNILLVIGNVSVKQYKPASLDLLEEGTKPKVVRLTDSDVAIDPGIFNPWIVHSLPGYQDLLTEQQRKFLPLFNEYNPGHPLLFSAYCQEFWGFDDSDVVGIVFSIKSWENNVIDEYCSNFAFAKHRWVAHERWLEVI